MSPPMTCAAYVLRRVTTKINIIDKSFFIAMIFFNKKTHLKFKMLPLFNF